MPSRKICVIGCTRGKNSKNASRQKIFAQNRPERQRKSLGTLGLEPRSPEAPRQLIKNSKHRETPDALPLEPTVRDLLSEFIV